MKVPLLSLLEPATSLLLAHIALPIVGVGPLRRLLSISLQTGPVEPSPQARAAAAIVKARLDRVSRYVSRHNDCLPRSIAAAMMLRARGAGSTLHFGILKPGGEPALLRAHAWLSVGESVVAGEETKEAFLELRGAADIPI